MSQIDFPLGHPEIRRGHHSCKNLLNKLQSRGQEFIGVCQVCVLPRMIYLFHVWCIKWMENYCFVCVGRVHQMEKFK